MNPEATQTVIRKCGTLSEILPRTLLDDLMCKPALVIKVPQVVARRQKPAYESALELMPEIVGRMTADELAVSKSVSKNTIYNYLVILLAKKLITKGRDRSKTVYWRIC